MAKKVNKRNKGNECVYYACLRVINTKEGVISDELFLSHKMKVYLDYDLYNSFKKMPNGNYFLNEKNEKLIEKTLKRFQLKALVEQELPVDFEIENMQILTYKCDGCGCKHIVFPCIECTSELLPENRGFLFALDFMSEEFC